MEKQIYDEKFHAGRLIKLLQRKDICGKGLCPAGSNFSSAKRLKIGSGCAGNYGAKPEGACVVCQEFVGITRRRKNREYGRCPCYFYGCGKAIELTVKALKEKGYL